MKNTAKIQVRFMTTIIFMVVNLVAGKNASAEIKLIDDQSHVFSISPYFRADMVSMNNNIDLDSKNSDDSSTYMGIDYSLGLDFKFKDEGPQFYLKLERNGPYDYDAPLFIYNTLRTSTDQVERYRNEELLPAVEEIWADFSLRGLPLRIKSGLYAYEVGHGLALCGSYEEYGVSIYGGEENLKWRFYYSRPDLEHKSYWGERPPQEKEQGIDYEHAKANFFAADTIFSFGKQAIQPYVGVLADDTNFKRASLFLEPTHKDILGTFGASWTANWDKFSLGLEAARNFGKAKSSDDNFKDVEHTGYAVFMDASYAFTKFTPHSRFLYASGNKVTTEMVDNGDEFFTSGKNRAFSNYSPFNTTLADSHYPNLANVPLIAMGNGWGLNYGIPRPGTFGDPIVPDNLILSGLGFDYAFSDKLSLTFDWWYLRTAEKGVGMLDASAIELPADLGNEVDVSCNYSINDHLSVSLAAGYFFPGRYYKAERDATSDLFTPFLRGDGEANGAYQIELSTTITF
jgi:hypothetical protein